MYSALAPPVCCSVASWVSTAAGGYEANSRGRPAFPARATRGRRPACKRRIEAARFKGVAAAVHVAAMMREPPCAPGVCLHLLDLTAEGREVRDGEQVAEGALLRPVAEAAGLSLRRRVGLVCGGPCEDSAGSPMQITHTSDSVCENNAHEIIRSCSKRFPLQFHLPRVWGPPRYAR